MMDDLFPGAIVWIRYIEFFIEEVFKVPNGAFIGSITSANESHSIFGFQELRFFEVLDRFLHFGKGRVNGDLVFSFFFFLFPRKNKFIVVAVDDRRLKVFSYPKGRVNEPIDALFV